MLRRFLFVFVIISTGLLSTPLAADPTSSIDDPSAMMERVKAAIEARDMRDVMRSFSEAIDKGSAEVEALFPAMMLAGPVDPRATWLYANALRRYPSLSRMPNDNLIERLEGGFAGGLYPAAEVGGYLLIVGRHDLETDIEKGHHLLLLSAKAGYEPAMTRLYQFYAMPDSPLYDSGAAQTFRSRYAAKAPRFVQVVDKWEAEQAARLPLPKAPSREETDRLIAALGERPIDAETVPVFQCPPAYPPFMRMKGEGGTVVIRFLAAADGFPEEVSVMETTDHRFDQAAKDAVHSWRFAPAQKDGKPVSSIQQVPIIFKLTE